VATSLTPVKVKRNAARGIAFALMCSVGLASGVLFVQTSKKAALLPQQSREVLMSALALRAQLAPSDSARPEPNFAYQLPLETLNQWANQGLLPTGGATIPGRNQAEVNLLWRLASVSGYPDGNCRALTQGPSRILKPGTAIHFFPTLPGAKSTLTIAVPGLSLRVGRPLVINTPTSLVAPTPHTSRLRVELIDGPQVTACVE